MEIENIKKLDATIKKLLSEGRVSDTIEFIKEILKEVKNDEIETQFVLISARFSMDKNERMLGVKSGQIDLNQIILALLQFSKIVIGELFSLVEQADNINGNESSKSAAEIFDKLKKDSHLRSIFDSLLNDLDSKNKTKLLELIILHSVDEEAIDELEHEEDLIDKLKARLNETENKVFVNSILKYAKDGKGEEAFSFFKFFKDEVELFLNKQEREDIAKYILSYYSDKLKDSTSLAINKTFSSLGKFIYSKDGIRAVKEFCEFCIVHFGGSEVIEYEMDLFEQIINKLDKEIRQEIILHIHTFLAPIDRVPKDIIKWFVNHAMKREIMHAHLLH